MEDRTLLIFYFWSESSCAIFVCVVCNCYYLLWGGLKGSESKDIKFCKMAKSIFPTFISAIIEEDLLCWPFVEELLKEVNVIQFRWKCCCLLYDSYNYSIFCLFYCKTRRSGPMLSVYRPDLHKYRCKNFGWVWMSLEVWRK